MRRRSTTASWTRPHGKALELNPRDAVGCVQFNSATPVPIVCGSKDVFIVIVSHYNYANLLNKRRRYDEAKPHEKVVEINPRHVNACVKPSDFELLQIPKM